MNPFTRARGALAGLALVLLGAASLAAAQPAAKASPPRPDPLQADAPVPPAVYRSSLAQHRRHAEQPVQAWSQSNDTVNRIGGWRAYAREAHEAQRAASSPARP